MQRYAHHDGAGLVDNVIVLDPDDCGDYPLDNLVQLPDDSPVGIGWTVAADGTFTAPPPDVSGPAAGG